MVILNVYCIAGGADVCAGDGCFVGGADVCAGDGFCVEVGDGLAQADNRDEPTNIRIKVRLETSMDNLLPFMHPSTLNFCTAYKSAIIKDFFHIVKVVSLTKVLVFRNNSLEMSINIGIIGLPKSGKTTIFNALTRGRAETGSYGDVLTPHFGVAKVPDARLKKLADIFKKPMVQAEIKYTDVGASVKNLVKDKGIGGELLNQLAVSDCLINVVRAFSDETIPHPEGKLDIGRDIGAMNLELAFSDLAIIERRLEKIKVSLKSAKAPERPGFLRELETMSRFKADLEKDTPLRELSLTAEETRAIVNYQFLTAKPLLTIANIGEEQLADASLEAELNSRFSGRNSRVLVLCGKLEMELAQLDENAAGELRCGFGIKESGLDRVIRESYDLLGLLSFFTIGSNEVRAWSIPKGTTAVKAAGKVHTDMERGFIRAEVISFEDLVKSGNLSEARKKGILRLEGKDYIVKDGDVITILFNV